MIPGVLKRSILERYAPPQSFLAADDFASPKGLAEEMKRINADWQLHSYAGVMHAFTNPGANDPGFGAVYDQRANDLSWVAMKRFFEDVMA